ncbi:neocarzinostatin apoprotein domain-containing protein [Streptomyces sp. NPDC051567]|uniref:neocarzinostatin apoprotein domain-containing protein n=1 Tax=Streptomyces sp. NPDC051567 TaxID=3365660 RepID=UPI0037888413
MSDRKRRTAVRAAAVVFSAVLCAALPVPAAAPAQAATQAAVRAAAEEPRPAVALSLQEAAPGTGITVTGTGWRARTTVALLVCGQNMAGGTSGCANAAGAVVTVADGGRFTARLSVAAPPEPCPCVVGATSVDGDRSTVTVPLTIPGHPVAAPPAPSGTPRLAALTGVRLTGGDGVLTRFGAPPARTLRVTVANLGPVPVTDPVFRLATAHGVFAPSWEETPWKGTIAPGGRADLALPVALAAGAHGAYRLSLTHGAAVVATGSWDVDRPYGVLLFRCLLLLVVPVAAFRTGMALVDRVRPRAAPPHRPDGPGDASRTGPHATTAASPWSVPDTAPGPVRPPRTPAPSENRPTTKGPS